MIREVQHKDIDNIKYLAEERPFYNYIFLVMAIIFWVAGYFLVQEEGGDQPWLIYVYIGFCSLFTIAGIKALFYRAIYCFASDTAFYAYFDHIKITFLEIPWNVIDHIELGIYGLNTRGLHINLKAHDFSTQDIDLIKQLPCVDIDDPRKIVIKQLSGTLNREQIVEELNALRK